MTTIRALSGLVLALSVSSTGAQNAGSGFPTPKAIPAPKQEGALPLYPHGAPAIPNSISQETWMAFGDDAVVRNVTQPTITPYLPAKASSSAAVIVAPGGGFMLVAIDNEGYQVAKWLADHGVTAFLLKYRVMPTPVDIQEFTKVGEQRIRSAMKPGAPPPPPFQPAIDDGVAALKWVRERSAQWHIDPKRVGLVGFSAGAMTALQVTLSKDTPRPAFVGLIYGPLAPVEVPSDAPPLFAALAADDPLFAHAGFGLIDNWRNAGHPVEFHLYQNGGHGFGMHSKSTPALWPEEFLAWMKANHMAD